MAEADDVHTDDDLAAEYVLGVLDADMRAETARRIERDDAFARLVASWEARLSGLNVAYEEQTPPAAVKAAIDARLFPQESKRGGPWRAFGGFLAAGFAVVVAAFFYFAPAGADLGAELRADGSDYVIEVEVTDGQLTAALIQGAIPADRTLELWQIVGDAAPVSLGTIEGEGASPAVPYAEGQIVAVSLEPAGGSPTGAPTGPVVALGTLKKI